MRVGVIGTGYVGLLPASVLLKMGNDVTLMDIDQAKISALTEGRIPIYEPGLEQMVARNVMERGCISQRTSKPR